MAAAAAASRHRRRQPTAAAAAPLAAPGPAPPRPPRPLGRPAPAACGEERQRGGRGRVSGGGAMGLIGTAVIPSSIHLSSIRACKPCQACASFPESAMPVAKIAHGQHDWGSRGGGSSASGSGRDEREEGGARRHLRPSLQGDARSRVPVSRRHFPPLSTLSAHRSRTAAFPTLSRRAERPTQVPEPRWHLTLSVEPPGPERWIGGTKKSMTWTRRMKRCAAASECLLST